MEAISVINDQEDTCIVCFCIAKYYSIGECDHPVCSECSTRMRVLCSRTECPICRNDMAMVVFVEKIQPFATLQYRNMRCERRYSIYFENDHIMRKYDALLQHYCAVCQIPKYFKTFNFLKDHMRKAHEQFYCDICDSLKVFTKDRHHYSRQLLATHRRKGDIDDTSHRGHPLCEFCNSRFMDSDELFRHMRRDHFFCHFCDADGFNQYYSDYSELQQHFRKAHFLCEEGNCMNEKFTSAFRTKLDLQAHRSQHHLQSLNKIEARQARVVDVAFAVSPRQTLFTDRVKGGARPKREETDEWASEVPAKPQAAVDINCVQDFPSLQRTHKALSDGTGSISGQNPPKAKYQRPSRNLLFSEEEFPTLCPASSSDNKPSYTSHQDPRNFLKPKYQAEGIFSQGRGRNIKSDPSRIGARPKICNEDFPTLQDSSAPVDESCISWGSNMANLSSAVQGKNIIQKPNEPKVKLNRNNFRDCDFPALTPSVESQLLMRNYSGLFAASAPIKKANKQNQMNQENVKSKKKSEPIVKKNSVLANSKGTNHRLTRKPLSASNEADEGPREDFSKGKIGEYESVAPVRSSNVNFILADEISYFTKSDAQVATSEDLPEFSSGDFPEFSSTDFPVLAKSKKKMPVVQNGNSSWPHILGKSNSSSIAGTESVVPPGFRKSNISNPSPAFLFPPNFEQRNVALLGTIHEHCNGDAEKFMQFKTLSDKFRKGEINGEQYYENCQTVMGQTMFHTILSELLVLLPDISKQQSVLEACRKFDKGKSCASTFAVCAVCRQVLILEDFPKHMDHHD